MAAAQGQAGFCLQLALGALQRELQPAPFLSGEVTEPVLTYSRVPSDRGELTSTHRTDCTVSFGEVTEPVLT